jgi:hypothetical protein
MVIFKAAVRRVCPLCPLPLSLPCIPRSPSFFKYLFCVLERSLPHIRKVKFCFYFWGDVEKQLAKFTCIATVEQESVEPGSDGEEEDA